MRAPFLVHAVRRRRILLSVAGTLLGVALLLFALNTWLGLRMELDARHRASGSIARFDFASGTFAGYDAYAQERLRAARPAAGDDVIAALAPFRLEPPADCPAATTATYRSGIVLTHDLLDSPYVMRELGAALQARCFMVYGLLLPGHGSRPGDLLRTDWEEWAAAEAFAARELGREVENLYLGGHGAGGALAILESATNANVDGLVLFAPTLAAASKPWQAIPATALGWLLPALRWAEVLPTVSAYRYDSWPYRLAGEGNALIAATHAALPSRSAELPVFTVLSMDDVTTSPRAILEFMTERFHPLSHTLVYTRHQANALPGMSVVRTYHPDDQLLSLSHLGLMTPLHDPEFGWHGSGKNCGHYYHQERAAYARCMVGERAYLGEITPENLEEGLLERIAFNPFFYDMLERLDTFIAPVGRVRPRMPR